MTYETGAKTHGANNLVLSVMSDGAVYQDRKHIVYAYLQSASHRGMRMRDIVETEARKQRARGCRFSARDISEAASLVFAQTLRECIDTIVHEWDGNPILARGLKWFDRINGNTYFSARMQIPNGRGWRIVDVPYQYGYGNQWQHECISVLRKMGFTLPESVPWYELPIQFSECVYARKRDMFAGYHF